jgi:hypothetical protein
MKALKISFFSKLAFSIKVRHLKESAGLSDINISEFKIVRLRQIILVLTD